MTKYVHVIANIKTPSSHTLLQKSLPAQARLFKSLKLWSYYVDLEESIGSVETTKTAYDKILELRIANAQVRISLRFPSGFR